MNSSYLVDQTVASVRLGAESNEVELIDATSGVNEADLEAMLDYAARVELLNRRFDANNIFSFTLPSERAAIGRITPRRNAERSVDELYFQCLVITPETFYHAGANPSTIIHLALNTMRFALYSPGKTLLSFPLIEGGASVKVSDLRLAMRHVGARSLVALTQAVLENRQTFFVANYNAYFLLGCVFSLLPLHARRALTFAVGMRFRNEPNMRLVGATIPRRLESQCVFSVEADSFIDVRDTTAHGGDYPPENAWGALIERVLLSDELERFALRLSEEFVAYAQARSDEPYPIMTNEEVVELGRRWLQDYSNQFEAINMEDFYGDVFDRTQQDEAADLEVGDDNDDEFTLDTPWNDFEREKDGEEWKEGLPDDYTDFLEESQATQDGWKVLRSSDANDIRIIIVYPNPSEPSDEEVQTTSNESNRQDEQEDASIGQKNVVPTTSVSADEIQRQIERDAQGLSSLLTLRGQTSGGSNQVESESTPRIVGLNLAPFALLTGEFPERDVLLRKLDTLVSRVIARDGGAKDDLTAFWNELRASQDDDFILRVRGIYLSYLNRKRMGTDDEETSDHVSRLLGVLDVIAIMI